MKRNIVLANIPYYYPRVVRESMEITKQHDDFNKDNRIRLSQWWKLVLYKLQP